MSSLPDTQPITPLISLVCPALNEAHSLAIFFEAIDKVILSNPNWHFEIVCVDDGSKDNTLDLLRKKATQDSHYKVIELSRNFGKEAALTAGIDHALGDAVIPFDVDLQDPPELIPKMITLWQEDFDIVLARRIDRAHDSFFKRLTARWFYRLHNRLSDTEIPDNVGDFRLLNRSAVNALKRFPERQRFMKGLFASLGFQTATLDYDRPARSAGSGKFSAWKLWTLALDGITSFSTAPLRIWMYIGSIGALCSLVYGAFIVVRTLIHGVDVPGYASILVAILFLGSLQLISIGILGEYIGRIYAESKQRPLYIVRNIYNQKNTSLPAKL